MPLGGLLALAYVVFLSTASGFLWYYTHDALPQVLVGSAYLFAASKAVALVALQLFFLGLLFLILARVIVRPVRELTAAIARYAERGEKLPVRVGAFTPRQVKELIGVFATFSAKVEAAEKHNKEVTRVKSDFISTAAHQLRTPLTAVRWALEALQGAQLPPEQKALVDSAVEKSRDLVSIVGTLLDISSIESGKYKYQFVTTFLPPLLEESIRDFTPMAREHGVALGFARGETVPSVRADRERFKWILNNLIENAIRYTPAGGAVQLSLGSSSGKVFLHVKDTGIGIPVEDRNNIFERFFRAGNAVAKENEGNGLGLYIARQVAHDHGGDLSFAPNGQGAGTTFTLSLPAA